MNNESVLISRSTRSTGVRALRVTALWYWHFLATDPREDLEQIDTPLFAVFAGADEDVPWRSHLPELVRALAESRNSDVDVVVLPNQDHFLLEFEGERLEKHNPGEMLIADELFAVLDAELRRRSLMRDGCAPRQDAR